MKKYKNRFDPKHRLDDKLCKECGNLYKPTIEEKISHAYCSLRCEEIHISKMRANVLERQNKKQQEKKNNKEIKIDDYADCPDPGVRGRLRDGTLENMRMGTAWGIKRKFIPKAELIRLRKKYEPEKYNLKSDSTSSDNKNINRRSKLANRLDKQQ